MTEPMGGKRDIDAAIDRLDDTLRGAGLAGLTAPKAVEALDDVAEAVTPYTLPADLRRFWERVDPRSIPVTIFPELVDPSSALELQRVPEGIGTSVPMIPPPLFFVIGYSSHVHRSIELGSEWNEGGTILRWAWDESVFRVAYRGLIDLVEVIAELVSEGCLEHRGGFILVPSEAEEARQRERLAEAGAHPMYGETLEITQDLEAWPIHWLHSAGIDLRDREPIGATHTIAQLVAASRQGPVTARVTGAVVRVAGIGGDILALVEDDTGQLDVWCPAGTTTWGWGHRRRAEFEVTVEGPVLSRPDFDRGYTEIQRHALEGRLEQAQAAADAYFGRLERHRPAAVATAIRPLD